jgi:hypothetical protein
MESINAPLVSAYRRQLALYSEVLALTRREVVEGEDAPRASETLDLLRAKARLLGEISEIEAAIEPSKSAWSKNRAASAEPMEELNGLLAQISRMLEEILRLEEQGRRRFALSQGLAFAGGAVAPASRAASYDIPAPAQIRVSVRG